MSHIICSSTDVHTVASLLKLYLRQLPEPLIPYNRYQDFLLCGQHLKSDRVQVTSSQLDWNDCWTLVKLDMWPCWPPLNTMSCYSIFRVWRSWGTFSMSCQLQTSTFSTSSASKDDVLSEQKWTHITFTLKPTFMKVAHFPWCLCAQVSAWGAELLWQQQNGRPKPGHCFWTKYHASQSWRPSKHHGRYILS